MTLDSETILAVDDEPLNLEIIEANLQADGCRIVAVLDGVTAWSLLQADPKGFDVVVLDRMMPTMDGMLLLARMKADPALRQIPVIIQTAAADPLQRREGLAAGAYGYLCKPYDRDSLCRLVRDAIRFKRSGVA